MAVCPAKEVVAAKVLAISRVDVGSRARLSIVRNLPQFFPTAIVWRPVRTCLEGPISVILPAAEQCIHEAGVVSGRQVPHIAEYQPVTDVEQGIAPVEMWPGPVSGETVARSVAVGGRSAAVPGGAVVNAMAPGVVHVKQQDVARVYLEGEL